MLFDPISFGFEQEKDAHWKLMQLFDGCDDYPPNLTLAQLIRLIERAEHLLWFAMYDVTEDGEIVARWRAPIENNGNGG